MEADTGVNESKNATGEKLDGVLPVREGKGKK